MFKVTFIPLCQRYHDNVIEWKHFQCYWTFVLGIHRSPVNFPHNRHWRGALMFSLICARINDWVNIRGADDLRRYCDNPGSSYFAHTSRFIFPRCLRLSSVKFWIITIWYYFRLFVPSYPIDAVLIISSNHKHWLVCMLPRINSGINTFNHW